MKTKNAMKDWLAQATPHQQRTLARLAKTTLGTLRHIAGGYRTAGVARAEAGLAGRVEEATRKMGGVVIYRVELNAACAACRYARDCKNG